MRPVARSRPHFSPHDNDPSDRAVRVHRANFWRLPGNSGAVLYCSLFWGGSLGTAPFPTPDGSLFQGAELPIPKSQKIWFNGHFVPWDDAKIHVLSHVVNYGSAVFEGIRCYHNGQGVGGVLPG